ncbi:MAG: hypothetical protein VX494_14750 [Actinomycetota bacterium]|nr:hypothetical protein [Actinomycetota bacterium]
MTPLEQHAAVCRAYVAAFETTTRAAAVAAVTDELVGLRKRDLQAVAVGLVVAPAFDLLPGAARGALNLAVRDHLTRVESIQSKQLRLLPGGAS